MFLQQTASETDSQYAERLFSVFLRNHSALESARSREVRNWRMYSGVDDGQWDAAAIQLLRDESRPAHTINFVQGAVDLAFGILAQNPHSTRFSPMEAQSDTDVNLAQWLYDFEQDRGAWKAEETMFLISGLVFKGVAQYMPDFQHNPAGNVGWKALVPWEVDHDSRWSSTAIRDCRFTFKYRKVHIDEICATYSSKSEEVRIAKRAAQEGNGRFDIETVSKFGGTAIDYADGDMYTVVEIYFQEVEQTTRLVNLETGKETTGTPEAVMDMAVQDHPEKFKKMVDRTSITKVVTICPGLDSSLILAKGSYSFQLGHLPFFFWSAKNLWGERQGMVDLLHDMQTMLNKRESSITHWDSLNANSSVVADASLFPDENDRRKLESNLHKPNMVHWADGGMRGTQGALQPVVTGQPPLHLANGSERILSYFNLISGLNAPINPNGGSGGMGANSKHYAEILSASFVKYEFLHQTLSDIWALRAEGFIPAAQYIYSGPPRRLKSPLRTDAVEINKPVLDDQGQWSTVNSIANLTRYDFTIEISKEGANKKQQDINDMRMQLPLIANPLLKTAMEGRLIDYGDYTEEFKKEAKEYVRIFNDFQKMQMISQTKQMETQMQQMEAQAQQAQQAPPGMPPPEPPPGPKDAARAPGQGEIPGEAGIAGSGTAANNVQSAHPSDMGAR